MDVSSCPRRPSLDWAFWEQVRWLGRYERITFQHTTYLPFIRLRLFCCKLETETRVHTHTYHASHTFPKRFHTLPSRLGIQETLYHLFHHASLHSAKDKWTISITGIFIYCLIFTKNRYHLSLYFGGIFSTFSVFFSRRRICTMPQEQDNHEEHLLSGKVLIITPLHKVPLIKTNRSTWAFVCSSRIHCSLTMDSKRQKQQQKTTTNFRETMRALRSRHLSIV